jgi:CHAD domain-containing protein
METIDAAGRIFATLLSTMERNVPGIREDIDTEFLHDFRVSVRRTRAGLAQIKDVYSPRDKRRHADGFKRLGRLTNRLRDLDVYLLDRARYEGMLPETLRPGLEPMFEKLGRERAREHARVVAAFDGGGPAEQLGRWRAFLESAPERSRGDNAGQPVAGLASRWIRKRHARLLARGRAIDDSSGDDALHALRIEGKKLRYLLEFFSSLYDRERVEALIRQLKKLQDNLGEFNDLSVQTADLGSRLAGARSKADTAAAIGGLMTALDARRADVRRHFAATFREFDSVDSGRTYDELFGATEDE